MHRNVVGLDIAKQVFHLFMMLDDKAVKRKLKCSELLTFIAQLPPSLGCAVRRIDRDRCASPLAGHNLSGLRTLSR